MGINKPRSRGDREEVFGERGASWKGAFVRGDLLAQAVTVRADGGKELLYGHFPSYSRYRTPEEAPAGTTPARRSLAERRAMLAAREFGLSPRQG